MEKCTFAAVVAVIAFVAPATAAPISLFDSYTVETTYDLDVATGKFLTGEAGGVLTLNKPGTESAGVKVSTPSGFADAIYSMTTTPDSFVSYGEVTQNNGSGTISTTTLIELTIADLPVDFSFDFDLGGDAALIQFASVGGVVLDNLFTTLTFQPGDEVQLGYAGITFAPSGRVDWGWTAEVSQVPIPATIALFPFGLAALGGILRRRRNV